MCVKTRKHKETERATGVRNPTTARRQDNVRSGRHFQLHVRNGRQIYARTLAIRARSKYEIPTNTTDCNKLQTQATTHLYGSVKWVEQQFSKRNNLRSPIPPVWTVHENRSGVPFHSPN